MKKKEEKSGLFLWLVSTSEQQLTQVLIKMYHSPQPNGDNVSICLSRCLSCRLLQI